MKRQYTILVFDTLTKERSFGSFYATKSKAEECLPALAEKYPTCKFTVASVTL